MAKPNQLSFVVPQEVRIRLEQLSAESGRSVAALIRESVLQYLGPQPGAFTPDSLWSILRDPQHWATFKLIAIEMEAQAAPQVPVAAPSEPPAPAVPPYRHQRAGGVPPRNQQVEEDIEPPF